MLTSRRTLMFGLSSLALAAGLGLPAVAAPPVLPTLVPLPEAEAPLWKGYGRDALMALFDGIPAINPMSIAFIAVSAVALEDWRQELMLGNMQTEDVAVLDWLEREGAIITLDSEPPVQGWLRYNAASA